MTVILSGVDYEKAYIVIGLFALRMGAQTLHDAIQ